MQSLKKMLSKVGSKKEIVKAETGSDTVGVVPTVGASRSPSPSVSHVVSAGPPPSPGTLRAAAPPSSVGSNSLPPGVKVMHGPPPPGAKMMVGPPSAGHISPERSIGSPPPPGAKVMVGAPPPGVKVMHGPPPPGAKIMAGPPPSSSNFVPPSGSAGRLTPERSMPPGVKVMHGPPPPGMIVRKGPPPPGATLTAAPSGSVVVSPERSRALSSSPPPGVKVMHGPPPPGAKIMAGPPPSSGTFVAPSGSAGRISPERSLPPGVKVMHGAPPPGAKIMKAPPGSSPPGLSPERSITPPGAKMVMKGPPPPGAKLVSGPPSPQRNPTPPRTSTSGVPPLIGSPQKSVVSPAGRASPPLVPQRLSGQASSELNFTVEPPATSPPKSVPTKVPLHAPGTSPKTPQPATTSTTPAAPSPRGSSGGAGNLAVPHFSPPAPKNTSDAEEIELHSDRSSSLPFQVEPTPPATAAAPSGTPPVAPTSSRQAAATGQDSSTASFTVEVDGDALTQKPLKQASLMVGVASTSSFKTADPPAVGAAAKAAPAPVRIDARKEAEEATFPASQLHLTNLTSALRSRIVEQFFSVLCPQQYFGKMNKISKIKPIQSDRAIATGLTGNNSIFVCTKGSNPNRHFFPQLRLLESDAVRSNGTAREVAQVDTPVILYEAAPGNMLFADTELEGLRLLQAHQFSNSCFILASSSILFKEPEKYVLPLATLNLRWTPYASAASEPRCPIHNTELQLFDPYTKELACALCETKNEKSGNLVVIPDVLRPDSRRQILESLSHQLDEAQQSAKNWIGQHKRIAQLQENRKIAINQQFDLLLSAMESKRREFMEACDAEYGYAASEVARQVLVSDEKIHLLQAADHHCRMDVSRPLYSMQIATVAEGLAAGTQFPDTFSKNSLSVPGLSSGITPRLDGVMAELQSLTPYLFAAQTEDVRRTVNGGSRSPYNTGGTRSAAHRRRAVATGGGGQSPHSKIAHNESSINTEKLRHVSPIRSVSANRRRPTPTSTNVAPRAASALHSRGILSHNAANNNNNVTPRANQPPRRQNGAAMDTLCRAVETIESHTALRGGRDAAPQARSWGPRGSLPNGFGTSLFDHCLNELLVRGAAGEEPRPGVGRPMRPKSVVVQWAVEVLDAGDWVGLGVGVGCSIEEWERGRANDLSHLWIVPYGGINKTFLLRVVAPSGSTRARLTVHDAKGKQLSEEGSIPQWNVGRPAYPQITFGGRVGEVQMVEEPHIIAA